VLENDREQIAVAGEDRGARDVLLALEPCDQLLRKRSIICAQRRRTDAPDQSGLLSDLPEDRRSGHFVLVDNQRAAHQ
jgi:hypothetical protein